MAKLIYGALACLDGYVADKDGVLIVGSGQSGVQLAEEVFEAAPPEPATGLPLLHVADTTLWPTLPDGSGRLGAAGETPGFLDPGRG
jgi:hypothetical protein